MEKLQGLLSAERQREFEAHVSGQEKETEIQHLRQQLSRLEADRLSLSEQLRTLRSEAKVKGEETQRLKSELASERFQREHARQQLATQRVQITSTARLATTVAPPTTTPTPLGTSSGMTPLEADRSGSEEKEGEGSDIFMQEREGVATDSARMSY